MQDTSRPIPPAMWVLMRSALTEGKLLLLTLTPAVGKGKRSNAPYDWNSQEVDRDPPPRR